MKIASMPALCEDLPYWEFASEPVAHVILTNGTLVTGFESDLIDIECVDAEQVNQITTRLRSLLDSLPEGTFCQFNFSIDSDYETEINTHLARITMDAHPLIRELETSRVDRLKEEIESSELYRPRLRIYLGMLPERKKSLSFFSSQKSFTRQSEDEYTRNLEELSQRLEGFRSSFEGLGIETRPLTRVDLVQHAYKALNPNRSLFLEPPLVHGSSEIQADSKLLQAEPWLAVLSPREQLVFGDLILDQDQFCLDQALHQVITLKTLPEMTFAGMLSGFLRLPFHYEFCLSFTVPPQVSEMAKLNQKRRMVHSLSVSQGNRASDLESESKLSSTEELIRELLNTGQRIYASQFHIILKEPNTKSGRRELSLKSREVLSRLRALSGTEGTLETVGAWKVFKGQLPAAPTEMVRPKRMKTNNLADFLPIYGPRLGDPDPAILLHSRLNGLVSVNPYDSKLPNYNSLITGSSGAGKSFFSNIMLLQQMARNSRVFIIDIGGSYRKLTQALGGQYIEVNLSDQHAINPFDLGSANEPDSRKVKSLTSIIEQMIAEDDKAKLPKLERVLIEKSILEAYEFCRRSNRVPQLSDLMQICLRSEESVLNKVGKLLFSWTGDRPYGQLLDRPGSLRPDGRICCFDLKGLSSHPDLQSVMILILTDFILSQVEADRDSQKRIILDEAWELLKSPAASQFMEYCARTLRKTGSGITFITQGVEEIVSSPIGHAILNNTATKVVMLQRGDTKILRDALKLNSQELSLIQSLQNRKGLFSEAFMITGDARQVVRIFPQPLEYWLSTSDANDNRYLETLMASRSPNLIEALRDAAADHPFGVSFDKQLKPGGSN